MCTVGPRPDSPDGGCETYPKWVIQGANRGRHLLPFKITRTTRYSVIPGAGVCVVALGVAVSG
jgi:hypothetical protein